MRAYSLLLLALLATNTVQAGDTLETYVELRTGSFSSAAQAASDSRYGVATWHIAERPGRKGNVRWLYVENWLENAEAPYRQRMIRLQLAEDGSIVARGHPLPEPARYVGAWSDTDRLSKLDVEALDVMPGCDVTIVRTGPQRFEGQTSGAQCENSYRGARYAISQSVLTADYMTNWDRGFDADGNQVWGPVSGGYRFERIGDERARCDAPVMMLVFGTVSDRAAFGAYSQALLESGLYPDNGGYPVARSPTLEVFEGEPPRGRGVVISKFPCLEAAQSFWYADRYQREIIPLRQDISEFEVLVLPVVPAPDYAR